MRRLIVGLVLLVGCGSSGGGGGLTSAERALQGTWVFEVDANEAVGFTFQQDQYEFDDVALLTDGTFGIMIEVGSYTAAGGVLNLFPERWSCTGVNSPTANQYSVSASTLTLVAPTAIITFTKFNSMPGQSAARIGCFFDDGSFSQQPLAPL